MLFYQDLGFSHTLHVRTCRRPGRSTDLCPWGKALRLFFAPDPPEGSASPPESFFFCARTFEAPVGFPPRILRRLCPPASRDEWLESNKEEEEWHVCPPARIDAWPAASRQQGGAGQSACCGCDASRGSAARSTIRTLLGGEACLLIRKHDHVTPTREIKRHVRELARRPAEVPHRPPSHAAHNVAPPTIHPMKSCATPRIRSVYTRPPHTSVLAPMQNEAHPALPHANVWLVSVRARFSKSAVISSQIFL